MFDHYYLCDIINFSESNLLKKVRVNKLGTILRNWDSRLFIGILLVNKAK